MSIEYCEHDFPVNSNCPYCEVKKLQRVLKERDATCAQMRESLSHCPHDHEIEPRGGFMVPRTSWCPKCLSESTDCGKALLEELQQLRDKVSAYEQAPSL